MGVQVVLNNVDFVMYLSGSRVIAAGLDLTDAEYLALRSQEISDMVDAVDGGYITVTTDEGNIVVASADLGNIIGAETKYIPTVNADWVGDSIGIPDDTRDALDELAQRVTAGGL